MRTLFTISVALAFAICAGAAKADLVVVVHPNNPVNTMTAKEIQRLFLGRMSLFPNTQVKVNAVDQPQSNPAYKAFYKNVVKMSPSKLKRYRAYYLFSGKGRLPRPMKSSSAALQYVAENIGAITYLNKADLTAGLKVIFEMPD